MEDKTNTCYHVGGDTIHVTFTEEHEVFRWPPARRRWKMDGPFKALTVLCIVMLVAICLFLVFAVVALSTPIPCNAKAAVNPMLEYRWSFWTGCMVRVPGTNYFLPPDQISVVNNHILIATPEGK